MAKAPEDMTFEDLEGVVAGYCCRALNVPFVSGAVPLGAWNHVNFPMTDVDEHDGNPAVHYIDVITGHSMEISLDDLALQYKNAIVNKDLDLLRHPFGPKVAVPKETKLQLVILDSAGGTVTVFKHYIFPHKCKPSFVKNIIFGRLCRPNFMSQKSTVGKKILQYCLQNMGGHQFRCFDVLTEVAPGNSKTKAFDDLEDEDLDKGFDFLKQNAPRSSSDLQQLSWQTKQLRKRTSPIYGWPHALVEKALRCLSSDGALARKEFDWPLPLTERFYHKWALEMLEEVWNFDVASLVMLGEPNTGKSPLCRSILMAQCRLNRERFHLEDKPCLRITPEIDFLRGEAGSVVMGDFLDDPEMQHVGVKILKSFLDVGLFESMAWARWGAAKWVQNQPRAVAANAYEARVDEGDRLVPSLPFQKFWEMIRPAISDNASHADVNAILKRSVFIVVTKGFVYYRQDGVNEDPVRRLAMDGVDFLTLEAKEFYGKFKSNSKCFPPGFDAEVAKEQMWLSMVMKKKVDDRRPNAPDLARMRVALWGEKDKNTSCLEAAQHRIAVKQEIFEDSFRDVAKRAKIWSQELRASHTVIDLDSDEEMPADRSLEQDLEEMMDAADLDEVDGFHRAHLD